MSATTSVFTQEGMTAELRHCEIITDIQQHQYDIGASETLMVEQPFTIIASQDCDLLRDFESRKESTEGPLNGILVYEAQPISGARSKISGSDIWKRILQNKEDRYYFIESLSAEFDLAGKGLPGLVVDFRRFFSINPSNLYLQLTGVTSARRHCRLETPYREHFQFRAACYNQRTSLPRPHNKP